jgi:hypothetical protein
VLKSWVAISLAVIGTFVMGVSAARSTPATPPALGGCPLFPADNIWNVPVDQLPIDPNSTAYINTIGAARQVHADFGSGLWDGGPIGIPFVVVPGGQPLVPIDFQAYGDESDAGPYPVPAAAPVEGGLNSDGDRHVLVVRQGECKLYELYRAFPNGNGSWNADSGAVYTLTVNGPLRTAGWTSADAAGLPILPGLVRYDEAASGEINHAIRFTVPQTRRATVWPARHFASSHTGSQYPPMGQRFRLKAGFVIDASFSPQAQVILRALKKYGMILADNGSAWYLSGAPDERWDNDVLHELDVVVGADFEAVDVSSVMVNPDSGQVLSDFTLNLLPAVRAVDPGGSARYQLAAAIHGYWNNPLTITASSPSPSVTIGLSGSSLNVPGAITLTVTDAHPAGSPALWYSIPITATGGGVTHVLKAGLLIGGMHVYLPVTRKN